MAPSYFKRFGTAANLASTLCDLQKRFAKSKSEEDRDALHEIAKGIYDNCTWRNAYNCEINGRKYWTGSDVFRFIDRCAKRKIKYPTYEGFFWNEKAVVHFLSLLDELQIKEFVYVNNSTAVMGNLLDFINHGWKIVGSIEQKFTECETERVVVGLRIAKCTK